MPDTRAPHVWGYLSRNLDNSTARAQLAHLRRGVGKPPGSVPEMWPFYTTLKADGSVSISLRAEHAAMTMFAIHQQSRSASMHSPGGSRLGSAMRNYRWKSSGETPDQAPLPNAIDRRLSAIATAGTFRELEEHLRRAVSLLHREQIPLDYDRLYEDLVDWQKPWLRGRVIRRWGAEYFVAPPKPHQANTKDSSPEGGEK